MLADQIKDYIDSLYRSGVTQTFIARKLNVDEPMINRLISGKRVAADIKIGTFDKMFPAAVVSLTGGPVTVGDHNAGPVAGIHVGDNFLAGNAGPVPPEVSAVLASGLPPAEKAAILRALYHPAESEVQK